MAHKILILSRKFRDTNREKVEEFLAARNCELYDPQLTYPVSQDQLVDVVGEAEGIITGLEWISSRVIDAAPKLKVVSAGGVGFDHIDIQAANARGIAVGNCAGCNNHSVSELAFGMMVTLARNVGPHNQTIREGGWLPYDTMRQGSELWGKTLGIVGLGRVGRSTALLGKAFGMKLLASDIVWDITFANEHGISLVPFDDLLQQSDWISLHCPLTNMTRDLIDERAIDMMKPGAFLINTARGPIVNEEALVNGLASGKVAGAGLDVFRVEPHPDNPYTQFDNVVLTPHIGGSTQEAFDRSLYLALTNCTNVFNGVEPHCQVNPGVYPHLEYMSTTAMVQPPSSI